MPVIFEAQKNKEEFANNKLAGKDNSKVKHNPTFPESIANEKPTKRSISAYMVKPRNIHFETQDREEKIILLLRRHMISNLGWLLLLVFLFLLPLITIITPHLNFVPLKFQITFMVLWYLFTFVYGFERFLSWYYNIYIVTDERVVDVDFRSLLYKEVSQAKIENIQDVTFVMGGLTRTIFNYGTVFIQTAGEEREFDFEDVPHPDRVAKVINELLLEEEQEKIEGRVR